MAKLSPKEKAFCRAYINLREGQAAAIEAGYAEKSARVTASKLLTKTNIQEEVARLESKVEEKSLITKERVLKELALVGFSDMADCITVGAEGQVQVKTFDEMPEGASRAISRIKEKRAIRQTQGDSGDMIIDLQLEYGHHDKVDALKEIAKLNGYYPKEEIDLNHKGNVTVNIVRFCDDDKPSK